MVRTAIHFRKEDDPKIAPEIERKEQEEVLTSGAFVAACWKKP